MSLASHHASPSETPATKDNVDDPFLKQLLELHVGQTIQLGFNEDDDRIPDFHEPGNRYEVAATKVKNDDKCKETYFNITLGSPAVNSKSDPLFQITVSRNVSSHQETEWRKHWIQSRAGTSYGSPKWRAQTHLDTVTVVQDIDRCPECGQPT